MDTLMSTCFAGWDLEPFGVVIAQSHPGWAASRQSMLLQISNRGLFLSALPSVNNHIAWSIDFG